MAFELAKAFVSISADMSKFTAEMSRIKAQVSTAMSQLGKYAGALAIPTTAVAAFAKITSVIKETNEEIKQSIAIQSQMAAALKVTGYTAGFTARELSKFASEIERNTNVSSSRLKEIMTGMVRFENVSGKTFKDVVQLAVDMGTAFGSVEQASTLLSRVLERPLDSLGLLRKLGAELNVNQIQRLKDLEAENSLYGQQAIIIEVLQKKYADLAAEKAKSSVGDLERLQNETADFRKQTVAQWLETFPKGQPKANRAMWKFLSREGRVTVETPAGEVLPARLIGGSEPSLREDPEKKKVPMTPISKWPWQRWMWETIRQQTGERVGGFRMGPQWIGNMADRTSFMAQLYTGRIAGAVNAMPQQRWFQDMMRMVPLYQRLNDIRSNPMLKQYAMFNDDLTTRRFTPQSAGRDFMQVLSGNLKISANTLFRSLGKLAFSPEDVRRRPTQMMAAEQLNQAFQEAMNDQQNPVLKTNKILQESVAAPLKVMSDATRTTAKDIAAATATAVRQGLEGLRTIFGVANE